MNFTDNPFFLLDVSPRDSKQVIHEKAELKSFELPEDVCRNAERTLLTPKKRLEAEISWFPCVSPRQIKDYMNNAAEDARKHDYRKRHNLVFEENNLATTNAIAYYLSFLSDDLSWEQFTVNRIIDNLCFFASSIDVIRTFEQINADRVAAGFTEVSSKDEIRDALEEQQRFYRKILHSFLDKQDSLVIVEALTFNIGSHTNYGKDECSWPLLEATIADYEVEVLPFFEKQKAIIDSDIKQITQHLLSKASIFKGCGDLSKRMEKDEHFKDKITKLDKDVRLWGRIAKPIQILYKCNGKEHKYSSELAISIRNFSLKANNEYGLVEISEIITKLLSIVFAEVPIIAEQLEEDIICLSSSSKQHRLLEELTDYLNKNYNIDLSEEQFINRIQECIKNGETIISQLIDKKQARDFIASFLLNYVIKYVELHRSYWTGLTQLDIIAQYYPDYTSNKNYKSTLFSFYEKLRADNRKSFELKLFGIGELICALIGAIIGGCDKAEASVLEGIFHGLIGGVIVGAVLYLMSMMRPH